MFTRGRVGNSKKANSERIKRRDSYLGAMLSLLRETGTSIEDVVKVSLYIFNYIRLSPEKNVAREEIVVAVCQEIGGRFEDIHGKTAPLGWKKDVYDYFFRLSGHVTLDNDRAVWPERNFKF